MAMYLILSKFTTEGAREPANIRNLSATVQKKLKSECPTLGWRHSYAVIGNYDAVDLVEADSMEEVQKAALIIRSHGQATAEVLPATPWRDFLAKL